MELVTAAHDGVEITSNFESADDLRVQLEAPTEAPAAKAEAVAAPAEKVDVEEPPDPILERNTDGTFKTKAKRGSVDELRQNIARATWEREEAKRETERLKAEIAALKTPKAEPKADPAPVAGTSTLAETVSRPDIAQAPLTEAQFFERHPDAQLADFSRYVARYELALDRADREKVESQRTAQIAYHQALQPFMEQGTRLRADFNDKMTAAATAGIQFSEPVAEFLLSNTTSFGPALAYALVTSHQEDLRRINGLSPVTAGAELSTLASRLSPAASDGSARKAPPVSNAHPPTKPIGGAPVVADELPDEDEAYRLEMNRRELAKRR